MNDELVQAPELVAAARLMMADAVSTSKYAQKQLKDAGLDDESAKCYVDVLQQRIRDVAAVGRRSRLQGRAIFRRRALRGLPGAQHAGEGVGVRQR